MVHDELLQGLDIIGSGIRNRVMQDVCTYMPCNDMILLVSLYVFQMPMHVKVYVEVIYDHW